MHLLVQTLKKKIFLKKSSTEAGLLLSREYNVETPGHPSVRF